MNKLIAVVGMPGSGASTIAKYLASKGYPRIHLGGIIFQAMTEAGIEITPENQAKFRLEVRNREGKDFVAKKAITQARNLIDSGQKYLLIDGLYTWAEYRALKHEFPGELSVVAVFAPRKLRHRRLAQRPERPFTAREATERDWSEIENLEKGGPIAIADYYIINDGSLDSLYAQVDTTLEDLGFLRK